MICMRVGRAGKAAASARERRAETAPVSRVEINPETVQETQYLRLDRSLIITNPKFIHRYTFV